MFKVELRKQPIVFGFAKKSSSLSEFLQLKINPHTLLGVWIYLKTNPNFNTNASPFEVRGCKIILGGAFLG